MRRAGVAERLFLCDRREAGEDILKESNLWGVLLYNVEILEFGFLYFGFHDASSRPDAT